MTPSATANAKHADLWMILSLDRGFYTAHGWNRDPAFSVLFTKAEADEFIAAHANETVLAMRYDGMAHSEIRVIDQQKTGSVIHHDLHEIAIETLCELKSRGAADLPVEVVRHRTVRIPDQEVLLAGLARKALGELERHQSTVFSRKFDCALKNFDRALEAYRRRLYPYEVQL